VREAFVAEIPVVSPTHYEALTAWTRPGLDSQEFGISAAEQIELDTALKAYPGWVLQGYGPRIGPIGRYTRSSSGQLR
jgi:hypothetical protein